MSAPFLTTMISGSKRSCPCKVPILIPSPPHNCDKKSIGETKMMLNIFMNRALYLYLRQWNEKEAENYNKI